MQKCYCHVSRRKKQINALVVRASLFLARFIFLS